MLSIERLEGGGLAIAGELDLSATEALERALSHEIEHGEGTELVVDLSRLAFMDSSGIEILVRSAQELGNARTLVLVGPGKLVARILDLVGVGMIANVRIVGRGEQSGGSGRDPIVPGPSVRPPHHS